MYISYGHYFYLAGNLISLIRTHQTCPVTPKFLGLTLLVFNQALNHNLIALLSVVFLLWDLLCSKETVKKINNLYGLLVSLSSYQRNYSERLPL